MKLNKTSILAVLIIGVSACSSKPEVKEFPKSADAKTEIYNLETDLTTSHKQNVALLAPVSFEEAQDSLSDARDLEKEGKKEEKVLKEVALGRAYLDRAQDRAKDNEALLQDVLAARQTAFDANAHTYFPEAFNKIDKKIKTQTTLLEKDKKNEIKEKRSEFITTYMDLELAAIKEKNIGESKRMIERSVGQGARSLAPTTLNEANAKYSEADLAITKNRHDTMDIAVKSAAAFSAAKKLEMTTSTASGIAKNSPEDLALRLQAEEERMKATENALTDEHAANAALVASNSKLSEERELEAAYEKARQKFSPEEAEVYKQGKNLVIRMRGLEFPKAQAVIRGENFALLKKVDEVIGTFNKSSVMVEGHTDSTGGKAVNQKLSDARALAVKQYLEANTPADGASFDSQGYGFEKPLASNKSAEGRAQNRRVDVIISPSKI